MMLAYTYEDHLVKFPVAVEPKIDGMRLKVIISDCHDVTFVSRTDKKITTLSHLTKTILSLFEHYKPCFIDGEVIVETFKGTMECVRRKNYEAKQARLYVFDIVSEFTECLVYKTRRKLLEDIFLGQIANEVCLIPSKEVYDMPSLNSFYLDKLSEGYEGIIVKCLSSFYQHKRSKMWLKRKEVKSTEGIVVNIKRGTNRLKDAVGSLEVSYKETRFFVGSGLSDEQRFFWFKKPEEILGKVVEIAYQYETATHSLRHPIFLRIRDDLS